MEDDLFDELDRFQRSIDNIHAEDGRGTYAQQRDALVATADTDYDDRNVLQAFDSGLPALDAFDRELLASPNYGSPHGHSARSYGQNHRVLSTILPTSFPTRPQPSPFNLEHGQHHVSRSSERDQSTRQHFQSIAGASSNPTSARDGLGFLGDDTIQAPEAIQRRMQSARASAREHASIEPHQGSDNGKSTRSASLHTQGVSTTSTPVVHGISLALTRDLPDNVRTVFSFPLLNAVQSKSFGTIFKTDDNFVLSAPTGSGKTGVLELAICRLIQTCPVDSFKVIYLSPTKSLCAERQRDWKPRFSSLGLQCAELTGDTAVNQLNEVQHASIIITTPEKWDSITRKWKDRHKLMQMIKLFLIDEVHILKEERGATLEAVVSRMKSIGSDVRFVAISATIPNAQDIATWLGKDPINTNVPARMERFGEEFRPVKLQKHVCGYQGTPNDFGFDKSLSTKLPDVIARWSQRKPLMIFCSTRKSCTDTAKLLSNWWASNDPRDRYWGTPRHQINVADKDLRDAIVSGVAFHHAGLSVEDRTAVEKDYLAGHISVICCTSTLAIGVNLPCHMVIIKGTVTYQGQAAGGFKEYSDLETMQMLGRAGRPQFDNNAVAVIMTRLQRVAHFEKMISGQEILESCLHKNLIDHVNAEIGLGTITDPVSAKEWLTGTFLYVRLKDNPKYYQMDGHMQYHTVDQQLENYCAKAVALLEEYKLITTTPNTACTEFGDSMARYCVKFDTMKGFLDLPAKPKASEILTVVAKAAEFKEVRFRPGDKPVYRDLNKNQSIKFPVGTNLDSSSHKVSLIIQSILGAVELPTEDHKVRIDFQTSKAIIFTHIHRLTRCVVDCQLHLADSAGALHALMLARSLGAQVWDDSPLHLKQLDGIGLIGVRKLVNANITSFDDFHVAESGQIERALSRNPPFGTQLKAKAAAFPRLRVSLAATGEPTVKKGVSVTVQLRVDIGFLNEKTPGVFQRKAVYVCLLVDTSAGDVIHFGRISAKKLGNGQEVHVPVSLTSSTQVIRAFVMCDDIAGTTKEAVLKPDVSTSLFPPVQHSMVSLARSTRNPSKKSNAPGYSPSVLDKENRWDDEFDDNRIADEDLILLEADTFKNIDDFDDESNVQKEPIGSDKLLTGTQRPDNTKAAEPRQLSNGKWGCNHACKNKKTCKHRCCQEGLDKQPKPPKARLPKETDIGMNPNQRRLQLSSIKKASPQNLAAPAGFPSQTCKVNNSESEIRTTFQKPSVTIDSARNLTRIHKVQNPNPQRDERPNESPKPMHRDTATASSSDYDLDDLDVELIRDSSQLRSPRTGRAHSRDDHESLDADALMSGALPELHSDNHSLQDRSLQSEHGGPPTTKASPFSFSMPSDIDDRENWDSRLHPSSTDSQAIQDLFVGNTSDSLLSPKTLSQSDAHAGDKRPLRHQGAMLPGLEPKRPKPSNTTRSPAERDEAASSGSTLPLQGQPCPDDISANAKEELDTEAWFKLHFGTENFNYVG